MRNVFVDIFKLFRLTPKTVKTAKFSDFYGFYAMLLKFSIDFMTKNVENVQKGKI